MQTGYYTQTRQPAKHTGRRCNLNKAMAVPTTLIFTWLITSLGCVRNNQTVNSHRLQIDMASINQVLEQQVRDWNRGDIDAFMQGYWNSPKLSFSSMGNVTHGWQQTLDNYHIRYVNRQAMGRLTFKDLEMSALGPDDFLVLGSWHLLREKPISGVFTLIFRRVKHEWHIIHDHTSAKLANRLKP